MTQIDVGNTNKNYWEKILADSDLSESKEAPQMIEISAEEFKEITNLELLPEENHELEDDPIVNADCNKFFVLGVTRDFDSPYEIDKELLSKVDGKDSFFTGHQIIKLRRGNAGNKTGIPRVCPEWAMDTNKVRQILLSAFPKLATNAKQRNSAGRWARVIQLYFKSQMTHGQICQELNVSLPTIKSVIMSIKRAVSGLRANGTGVKTRKSCYNSNTI